MSTLILNGPRVWKGWMQKCSVLSWEHSVWWEMGRSEAGIFRGCFFSRSWWGSASCIFRNEICEINPWWEIKLILVKVLQSSVKVGLVLSINDASGILFSQICDKEAYLNNCAKLGSELNIWYDYLEPRNTDTHKTVLNFLQEMKNINFIESPRWVMEIEWREYFIRPAVLRPILHDMRVIKSPAEIALMRETCRIGAEAIKEAITMTRSLTTEGQVLSWPMTAQSDNVLTNPRSSPQWSTAPGWRGRVTPPTPLWSPRVTMQRWASEAVVKVFVTIYLHQL